MCALWRIIMKKNTTTSQILSIVGLIFFTGALFTYCSVVAASCTDDCATADSTCGTDCLSLNTTAATTACTQSCGDTYNNCMNHCTNPNH